MIAVMPSTTADQNPLLSWTSAPPFDQISAEHVEPAVDAALADAEARLLAGVETDLGGRARVRGEGGQAECEKGKPGQRRTHQGITPRDWLSRATA